MKKSAFTIIELLIVILIIGILMVVFQDLFILKNKDVLYGEACINNLYGDSTNFLYSAITSKAITSGSDKTFPDYYYISLDTQHNSIVFSYQTGNTSNPRHTFNNITLTGTVPANYNCKSNSYYITLTGASIDLQINKGLMEDISLRSMILSGSVDPFVGTVSFLLYKPGSNLYREIAKREIDSRSHTIKNKICLTINNTGSCHQRSQ